MYKTLTNCLVCGNKDLKVHCDMGLMPLVNNLLDEPKEAVKYPLVVNECPICTHKQLSIAVDPKELFSTYLYQTGTSESHKEFFMDFADGIDNNYKYSSSRILDIGSNDGTLLEQFEYRNWDCYGIEPCKELTINYHSRNLQFINDFFPTKNIISMKFDIITAFNVFAHNENPYNFLMEMRKLLTENGRIYLLTTPSRLDNYYHEHISYFTPQSMIVLASKCGIEVVSFKEVSMHGKSYLFEIGARIDVACRGEESTSLAEPVIAYGASASETVIFNYYKIFPEYTVDDNTLKQGKFIPGINSPIVSADHLAQDQRDLTIIVAHNLFDEIVEKIKKLRPNKQDKFERLV